MPLAPGEHVPLSETAVQANERVKASEAGGVLWRNNSGAFMDEHGRHVRYGLANDSKRVNQVTKSADLIGITRVTITPDMVGTKVGVFTAVECKAEGWKYTGTPREKAQKNYLDIVNNKGGIARFETGGFSDGS